MIMPKIGGSKINAKKIAIEATYMVLFIMVFDESISSFLLIFD